VVKEKAMLFPRTNLVSKLIKKKLSKEVDQVFEISKQGFDVHVKTPFKEIENILIEVFKAESNLSNKPFRLILDANSLKNEIENQNTDHDIFPIIYVNSNELQKGFGFVQVNFSSPDSLLSSVSLAIEEILRYFNLNIFLDVFDSDVLSLLKMIARSYGISVLIDAVVQTAFIAGFQGDSNKAMGYLKMMQIKNDEIYSINNLSTEKCAERFFSYVVLKGEDAHTFLKSSLSYYAVRLQGFSMTRASQVLQVSRTTLLEHLKQAERLGVSQFFEGYIQTSI